MTSILITATALLFVSCNNEESIDTPKLESASLSKSEVVDVLKNIDIDVVLAQEIHRFVTDAMTWGRDEKISFKNILSDKNPTRAAGPSIIKERLRILSSKRTQTRATGENNLNETDLLSVLGNSDFIIYWPYSEDWDGKELPTLVAAPNDEDAQEAYGYKVCFENKKMFFEKTLVDEDYMMQHPVWVINEEKEDSDVIYLPTSDITVKEKSKPKYANTTSDDSIYVWKLNRMKVTHQYDGAFKGGSDIDIQVAYPALTGYVAMINKFRVNFSRKTIRKKRWKDINQILNYNWRKEQITNGLLISEYDPAGVEITIEMVLSKKNENGTSASVTAKFKIQNHDEQIAQTPLDRSYILRHDTLYFDRNRVTMVAPIIAEE